MFNKYKIVLLATFLVMGVHAQNAKKNILNVQNNSVVKVGKNIITSTELEKTYNEMNNLAAIYGKNITRKEVLALMIDDYIIKDRIKDEKIVLDQNMFAQEINMMKYQFAMMKQEQSPSYQFSDSDFVNYVEKEGGYNYSDFEEKTKLKVLTRQFLYKQAEPKLQELARKTFESSRDFPLTIPNAQGGADTFHSLQEVYDQNEENFIQPSMVTLKHIYFRTVDQAGVMSSSEKQAVKQRANEALKAVRGGGDFDSLVLRFTDDSSSKEQVEDPETKTKHRGYIGAFPLSGKLARMTREKYGNDVFNALASLKVGSYTDVLESPYGFHIFYAISKKSKSFIGFEEAKPQIVQQLKQMEESKIIQEVYMKLIEDLRKKTEIKYFDKQYE